MAYTKCTKQTYLGSSINKTLDLVWRPYPIPEVRNDCFIARLPDELIAAIVELLPPEYYYHFEENYWCSSTPIPLLLVCKRWHDLYNSLIYRKISLDGEKWMNRRSRRLLQQLENHPSLTHHIRELDVYIECPTPATERAIGTSILAKCVKGLRSLKLGRLAESPLPTILLYGLQMQNLGHLEFTRGFRSSTPETVSAIQKLLSLPTLHSYCEQGRNNVAYQASETSLEQELEQVRAALPTDRHQNVTRTTFSTPDVRPQSMEVILEWPACLTSFSLTYLGQSCFWKNYTPTSIQRILNVHQNTLRNIELGGFCLDEQPYISHIPDFSAFPSLHTLSLMAIYLSPRRPSDAAARVATPALRLLKISFATEDQHELSPSCFDEGKAMWIADFAKHIAASKAHAQRLPEKLEISLVRFGMASSVLLFGYERPEGQDLETWRPWPWKFVEVAEKMVAKFQGISLRYDKGSWTPESWLREVKKFDQRLEE